MYNPQLETFIRAADSGSFSKAAAEAFITTSAVIKQINLLEANLQVKLFHRSHRGLTLTKAGHSLYQDAKFIIRYSQEAMARARSAMEESHNIIRIGTSPMTPANSLVELLPMLQKYCPDIKFQLVPYENTPENAREILRNLGQQIDVVAGLFDETLLQYRECAGLELCRKPLVCAMSIQHPLAQKERLAVSDLYGQNLMLIQPEWSNRMDRLRDTLLREHPRIRIKSFDFFDIGVFNRCENSSDILVTIDSMSQMHPLIKTVPVEWDNDIPFGLLHAPQPSGTVIRFLDAVRQMIRDVSEESC